MQIVLKTDGILKSILRALLIAWCDDLTDPVVIAAMKLAAKRGGNSFAYLETIFKDWANANIRTVDQARAYEKSKGKRKDNTIPFRKHQSNRYESLFDELRKEGANDQ
ncbi:DnaD domain protein [Bacillaceae bacterium SIJ1]|uniref:DnaD domain-containing protein n=1 Tax=Litoribacterium kuwaitense TaxID=1398745 RepID=UPI0013EA8D22|nr:DnaD domain protein [Litoribacterium kuwaitense]NGP43471.1 DnaD domain protein [Litoribacterium kuwaitense]